MLYISLNINSVGAIVAPQINRADPPSLVQIDANTLEASWGAAPGATSYDLRWKAQTDELWIQVSDASSPYAIANPMPETTYLAEVRAVAGAVAGPWSESVFVFTASAPTLWAPDNLPGLVVAYDATNAALITTDAGGVTSVAPSSGSGPTLGMANTKRIGQVAYNATDKLFNGNNSTNALWSALAPSLSTNEGFAYFMAIKMSRTDSLGTFRQYNPLTTSVTPENFFGGNSSTLINAIDDDAPHIFTLTRKRDAATGITSYSFYVDGARVTSASGTIANLIINELFILGATSGFGEKIASDALNMQYLAFARGEIGESDRQKYEGWMRANMPLVSGVTLIGVDGPSGTPHPYAITDPTTGAPGGLVLDNIPTSWDTNATVATIAGGYRVTATAEPTQLYASEAVDVTAGDALRLTGTIKAPAGTYPLVRVGRNANLTPLSNGSIEGYLIDFVTEKVIVGDGTAQTFTIDFLAPLDRLYFGFRLPNAPLGTEIEVTNLALTAQPETVAQGLTTMTNTIEHDGVVFSIQKADGSAVKVGRYYSDGSYWALNDEPVTNPLRITKARIAGRPDAESVMPYPGYAAYGTVPGQTLPKYDLTGLKFNGATLDSIYDKNGIYKIIAEGRLEPGVSGYDTDQNIQPYKTGKPVVFDKAVGIDPTIEADRISAPTAAIFIQEVGNENIPSVGQQHGVNYWVTLAVVTTEPSADAFRPPLTQRGARDVPLTLADIAAQVAALPNLPTPPEAVEYLVEAQDAIVRLTSAPVADGSSLGQSGRGRARRFGGCYAREALKSMGRIAAGLIYDFWTADEKAKIAAMVVQHGLDHAGRSVDRPGLVQYPAGSNTGIMLHSVAFASKMAPGNTMLSTAAALEGYWSDLQQRQRVTQFVIDTKAAQLIGHNGLGKSPAQRRPQPSLGEMLWLQGELEERPGSMTSGRNPAYACGNIDTPYWVQDVVFTPMFDAVLARIGAPQDPRYIEAADKEYYRKALSDTLGLATSSEKTDPLATIMYASGRSDGRPISASQWGLEMVQATTQEVKKDGLTLLRPLYPGVANATWLDLLNEEFMNGVFAYAEPPQYEVLTTTATFGEMTTTAGVNATTLIPGVTLNPTTGIISADGTQVATSLRWFRVRAWNSLGEAFAVIALEVAPNHLRSVYTSYSYCQPRISGKTTLWDPSGFVPGSVPPQPVPSLPSTLVLKFVANLQGAGGADGTLYWVMTEDPAYKNNSRPNIAPRTQDAPTAMQIKAGQRANGAAATFSGSVPVSANGWTQEFGLIDADLQAWGTIYDISVYWEPETGAAPAPVLQSVGTQFN